MYLRDLKEKDAKYMLEWMHDDNVVHYLRGVFKEKTLEDAKGFIAKGSDGKNLHMAICSDDDEYYGTVSLKNISGNCAEFAIAVRSKAMGKGYSIFAMKEIFRIASIKGIKKIYWCVNPNNLRALRFYDKQCFKRVDGKHLATIVMGAYGENDLEELIWYLVS